MYVLCKYACIYTLILYILRKGDDGGMSVATAVGITFATTLINLFTLLIVYIVYKIKQSTTNNELSPISAVVTTASLPRGDSTIKATAITCTMIMNIKIINQEMILQLDTRGTQVHPYNQIQLTAWSHLRGVITHQFKRILNNAISELLFCLPFYPLLHTLPEFVLLPSFVHKSYMHRFLDEHAICIL